jgi:hypothetical protein
MCGSGGVGGATKVFSLLGRVGAILLFQVKSNFFQWTANNIGIAKISLTHSVKD